jgi:C-terminal processing protease CtpA/Prc
MGFLAQLQSRVSLTTNGSTQTESSAVPILSKTAVLDGAYALLRVGRVDAGLAKEMSAAFDRLRSTNKLKGVVVDLRFAIGQDYAAAAQTADLFFSTEQPLLHWGDSNIRSTAKSTAIDLPLAILVNNYTAGAAEALAAALHQVSGSVVIGSPTAGHAYLFKDFPLSDGQVLRIASGSVTAGENQTLTAAGLMPDIRISLSLEDEKAYFEDPYRITAKLFAQAAKPGTNDLAFSQSTNRPRRRLNEAELVRMQRDGVDLESEPLPVSAAPAPIQVVTDPALARALDLLKGIALALRRQ